MISEKKGLHIFFVFLLAMILLDCVFIYFIVRHWRDIGIISFWDLEVNPVVGFLWQVFGLELGMLFLGLFTLVVWYLFYLFLKRFVLHVQFYVAGFFSGAYFVVFMIHASYSFNLWF